jgi:hypothetical protein
MPYGGPDYARLVNMAGLDEVVANERTRASLYPVTVGTVTFPTNQTGTCYYSSTGAPISTVPGATSTIDAGQLLTGIVIQAPSAGNTSTLSSAALLVAGINMIGSGAQIGDVVSCYFGNGSASNTITIAAGSGGAFDTNQPVAARTIAVNSSRWVMIRLTNVTSGSEAYVVYM